MSRGFCVGRLPRCVGGSTRWRAMPESVVHLRFPAKPDYLLLARLTLSGIARELPLGDEVLADLKLALTEACGNAVRHAYTETEGDVSVVFTIRDDRLLM